MRLLARAREVASRVQVAVPSRAPQSELEVALRRVTHSDCAAIPPEDLKLAINLIVQSEDALAKALRHIQVNVAAPPNEWRRVNGALALFEALAARGNGLVGRSWYEVKMEARLKELQNFCHDEDPRVATLIHRAAQGAIRAADALHWSDGVLDDEDPEVHRESELHSAPECTGQGSNVKPSVIGKCDDAKSGSTTPHTPRTPTTPTDMPKEATYVRCCCCCWRRVQAKACHDRAFGFF
ncbi:unnamed protein product [Durusdinium trenchii]|uniref:Uncharacterized protein n=1 Tax=Durusdinium trenchii TaxID=1381693 RepID=A0ABP0MGL8_9DINO